MDSVDSRYGVREAFTAIPLTALGQSEVNWHLLSSASPLSLCLHIVTKESYYSFVYIKLVVRLLKIV